MPRLEVQITTLVHVHSSLLIAYLSLPVGLGVALVAMRAARPVVVRLGMLFALVCAQGLVGTVQFFTAVPAGTGGDPRRRGRRVNRGNRGALGVDANNAPTPADP